MESIMTHNVSEETINKSINKHFPFDKFNPGQFEAIYKSVDSVLNGVEHTVLSCPTGVGKSVIAITTHNVLNEIRNSTFELSTVVVATTKGLQDQYNKDFERELVDLKGKTNYYCHWNIFEGYNSPKCIEKVLSKECSPDRCPYVHARQRWTDKIGAKTTNSSLLVASPHLIPMESPVDLCIIDECHEIDKVIIHQSSVSFDVNDYAGTEKHFKDFKVAYLKFINLFKEYLSTNSAFYVAEALIDDDEYTLYHFAEVISTSLETVLSSLSINPKNYKFVIIARELQDLKDKLDYFVNPIYGNVEWVMDINENNSITLTPIKSSGVMTESKLFRKSKQFIHMSATIGGIDTYCSNLGIDKNKITYIDIDNPIPIEQRQIHLKNMQKINRFTDIMDIVKSISPIIENESGNGIIHTVSFKLANDIKNNSPFELKRRMVVSNNRKEILGLLNSSTDIIILSPSVETGYDFKNDLARWQIIAKVPFLNLGDNYVNVRKDKNNNWYTREAVLRLIQACGRIVRGLSDYGNTYIIDENVLRLISNNTDMFPGWWINALTME